MRAATCCVVALLAVGLMLSTACAYQDEIPTFQSVYGQPPLMASGMWRIAGGGYMFLPPDIAVTQREILLSGAQFASPQVVRFARAGNATGVTPLYSWKVGQLDPAEPPTVVGSGEPVFPVAVAAAPSGAIYVADYDWAAWTRYAPDGTYLGGWGGREGLQPPFLHPTQICAAPDDSFYVLDVGLARVKHFSGDGVPLGDFGTPPAPAGGYSLPADIAAAGEDGLWLLNASGQYDEVGALWRLDWRVHRYDTNGVELSSWPVSGPPLDLPLGQIGTDSAGDVWVLAHRELCRFSPNGHLLAQLETTARSFAVSPDDLLWLLIPQGTSEIAPDAGWYVLETRDFTGDLVQSMGDRQDMEERGTLSGVWTFAGTPEGDSYALAAYPTDPPVSYISHFGPGGELLEVLPPSGIPIYNPVTGAVEYVSGFPVQGVGPDGCYYGVAGNEVESGDGSGDPSTWPGRVTVQRSRGDGSAPDLLTIGFPAGIANGAALPNQPVLAFGADGNFRVLVQGYGPLEGAPYPTHGPGPIWVATVTPQGETVTAWTAQPAPGLRIAASLVVDPAGDVYVGGLGGVWKYTAAGELVGRIGGYGEEGDNRDSTHSRISATRSMQLDAQGVLRVLDGFADRIFTFAYPVGPFPDVPWWSWCRDQVQWLTSTGITNGYPDGNYHPTDQVTRDQMAVYLARVAYGGDVNVPSGPAEPSFADVAPGYWAYRYIEACKSMGAVTGYGSEYRPALPVDRAQMAVFVRRVFPWGFMDPGSGPHFADVPEDHWAYGDIEYCVQNGIVQGYWDGAYHPERVVTRDQMAVFLHRGSQIPLP